MYLVNFIDSVSNSDIVFYALMILLTLISVILFYLIYTQNKELAKKMKDKSSNEISVKENNIPSVVKEVESLERPVLVETTSLEIPNPLELTRSICMNSDTAELQSITKELENAPKERKIEMTAYEAEQEETAIISYDELIKHSMSDEVKDKDEDISLYNVKDEENTKNNLENGIILERNYYEDGNSLYKHEEDFLDSLKELKNVLEK